MSMTDRTRSRNHRRAGQSLVEDLVRLPKPQKGKTEPYVEVE